MDELHLAFRVPIRLPKAEADAVSRTLRSASFRRRLRQALLAVCRDQPTLARCVVR